MEIDGPTAHTRPNPHDYLEHASQFHVAGKILLEHAMSEGKRAQLQISIGLFLQSIELSGKSILTSIGMTQRAIRKGYGQHDIYQLMLDAEYAITALPIPGLDRLANFLDREVSVVSYGFSDTLRNLLKSLKQNDQAGKARNYFYPDFPKFAALEPVGLNVAIEQSAMSLIEDSLAIAIALGWEIDKANGDLQLTDPNPDE